MCGIVGVLDPTHPSVEQATEVVGRMAAAVRHRGPDGSGVWVDADVGVAFGHRRLSILDVSDAGAQPMASNDGRWVLTFNGEIYNHLEVAERLTGLGARFRGHSDTEIMLAVLKEIGLKPE